MAADDPSTRFPFISLEKALARAETIFNGDRSGKPMLIAVAFELWGYSPKSSGAFQTVGALKGYGLLEDEGANAERKVRLTEQARRYFLDERDDVRAGMLATFALAPPLFRTLWRTDGWSSGIPADTVARSHLKLNRNLNDQSSRSLLGIFKENVLFAGLQTGDAMEEGLESAPSHTMAPKAPLETPRADQWSQSFMDQFAGMKPAGGSSAVPVPTGGKPGGDIDARISGDRVMIAANVDLQGLRKLKRLLQKYEEILTLDEDEDGSEEPISPSA